MEKKSLSNLEYLGLIFKLTEAAKALTVEERIAAIRKIATTHKDIKVREFASEIVNDLENHYTN